MLEPAQAVEHARLRGTAVASVQSICVCICTRKRPELLGRCLDAIGRQVTGGLYHLSIVVADNDSGRSAQQVVARFAEASGLDVTYCVEPQQNIALARNKALEHATGDFVAFIDDDEFPAEDWLTRMLEACERYTADGVLGPVKPHFDEVPPGWLVRGKFCERPEHPTGSVLAWRQTRTGNVLFRRPILAGMDAPFRREFGNGGEDQDFFRRLIAGVRRFVWCN